VICDFCLSPNVRWSYPAAPMPVASAIIDATDDDWAVCAGCSALIDAGDIIGLADRVVREQPLNVPPGSMSDGGVVVYPHPSVSRRMAMENIVRFMAARRGPPVPERT
jgi:hypothetical protein